jgi:transketolase
MAIQRALDSTFANLPGLMSGSADLMGSNGVALGGSTPFGLGNETGRYLHFGVREHAMGATAVGMSAHGGVLPVTATFFVFADYMRPPIRLAALTGAKVCFVFTHDSVGVGEDGPTHQPIEQLASLRSMPGLHVVRPADGNETIQAWADAVDHHGPTVLVLSRQNITVTTDGSAVATGAGIVRSVDDPQIVLVGTGSEVALCVEAAAKLTEQGVASTNRAPSTRPLSSPQASPSSRSKPESLSVGRNTPTHQSESTVLVRAHRAVSSLTSSASTSITSFSTRPIWSTEPRAHIRGATHEQSHRAAVHRARPERLARQPQA